MDKQSFFPRNATTNNTVAISRMGVNDPAGTFYRKGKDWRKQHTSRQETFSFVAFESYCQATEFVGYTNQETYIKVNFWMSGRHATVLDGYGQYNHDRPEVFITSGPSEMTKIDIVGRDTHCVSLSLCLLREFFHINLGLGAEELPMPLRALVEPSQIPCAFHRFPLTSDLAAAARCILLAPSSVRLQPIYAQAKAVELMCLLLNLMANTTRASRRHVSSVARSETRVRDARELIMMRYAEPITLAQICKEIGINKMALTTGFRQMFGMSVYDCLQKVRMERAYELLRDRAYSVAQVADEVGYEHACNFSTAFHSYFGCTPRAARGDDQHEAVA